MRSSYSADDVEILLKDVTGLVDPLPADEREKRIQNGTHYCEMLPLEYKPSEAYMDAYRSALKNYAVSTASAIGILAEKLYERKGKSLVIVSLARAGIPVGILLKRYLAKKYGLNVKHYAVSIIRGKGIDKNAVGYILSRHDKADIQFVDGWTGKGAILAQLKKALEEYPGLDPELGVASDPAGLTELCGTHEDILIPSSCLNATVTGLISRTFLRSDVIGETDFHGAVFYEELAGEDLSAQFLREIEVHFRYEAPMEMARRERPSAAGLEAVERIAGAYGVRDINFIKPGIGETTRVLLRRVPWKILVNRSYWGADELKHLFQLAGEKQAPCEPSMVDLGAYKVCGLIKRLSEV